MFLSIPTNMKDLTQSKASFLPEDFNVTNSILFFSPTILLFPLSYLSCHLFALFLPLVMSLLFPRIPTGFKSLFGLRNPCHSILKSQRDRELHSFWPLSSCFLFGLSFLFCEPFLLTLFYPKG